MNIYHYTSLLDNSAVQTLNDESFVLARVIVQPAIVHSYSFDWLYALKPKNPV